MYLNYSLNLIGVYYKITTGDYDVDYGYTGVLIRVKFVQASHIRGMLKLFITMTS